jgi:outer membrane usher protein
MTGNKGPVFRHAWMSAAMGACFMLAASGGWAEDALEFDPDFLAGGATSADLSRFARDNPVIPGMYRVDVYLNNVLTGSESIELRSPPGGDSAMPCVTIALLERLGVDLDKVAGANTADACVDLPENIAASSVRFDSSEQRLDVGIPQINLLRTARGYVNPARWDSGVTAGILNYNFNSFYSDNQSGGTQNYLGLSGGANLGVWRARYRSSLERNNQRSRWQNQSLYLQREVESLESQLIAGDTFTNGDLFDSFSLRGVQLASDERMQPDSLRGYAPTVRGVAKTNARVTIRQNGYVLLETTVSPGPFEIDDLYPTGYGGDLDVSIAEADGQVRVFKVPYAAVTRMLRPGAQRYNVAFGQYRSGYDGGNKRNNRWVGQLTYQRGLSNLFTGYGGMIAAQGYWSAMLGNAVNTPVGAFGLDVTHARTNLPTVVHAGQSARLSYSKAMPATGTNVSVAAYRYSTQGFYNLRDAMAALDRSAGLNVGMEQRQRSSMQITMNQSLGSQGSLYLTAQAQNYWGRDDTSLQYQLGYSGSTRHFSYSVAAMRTRDLSGRTDNIAYATITVPFGGRGSVSATGGAGRSGVNGQVSVNSTLGENNQFSWNSSFAHEPGGSDLMNLSGNYRAPYAELNAAAAGGAGYRQASFGAAGSVVAHPGGVTFGQTAGETIAIIEAPDAAGAEVTTQSGVRLDDRGFAIVPYLTPYRRNTINLDPKRLPMDVELTSTSEQVVPRAGAVVMTKFATESGRAVVIDLETPAGVEVPFGAQVTDDATGRVVGIVAQGGRVMARGLDGTGILSIRWGDIVARQCRIGYDLRPLPKGVRQTTYARMSAVCDPGAKEAKTTPSRGDNLAAMQQGDSGLKDRNNGPVPSAQPVAARTENAPS